MWQRGDFANSILAVAERSASSPPQATQARISAPQPLGVELDGRRGAPPSFNANWPLVTGLLVQGLPPMRRGLLAQPLKLIEQRLGLDQILCSETFYEPAADRDEEVVGLRNPPLVAPQPGE